MAAKRPAIRLFLVQVRVEVIGLEFFGQGQIDSACIRFHKLFPSDPSRHTGTADVGFLGAGLKSQNLEILGDIRAAKVAVAFSLKADFLQAELKPGDHEITVTATGEHAHVAQEKIIVHVAKKD